MLKNSLEVVTKFWWTTLSLQAMWGGQTGQLIGQAAGISLCPFSKPHLTSIPLHTIVSLPYSIHFGKKINVKSQSKVRSSQSEVHKCVSIS